MREPEVIGCSWLDEREFVGRGRVLAAGSTSTYTLDPRSNSQIRTYESIMPHLSQTARLSDPRLVKWVIRG